MSTADRDSTRFKEGEGGQVFRSLAESAVVVEVEMIETGSSLGPKWDFCRSTVIFEIPSPHLPQSLNPPLFHCP